MKNITVSTHVNNSIQDVWDAWTSPDKICKWYFTSDEWWCPKAENDLK